MDNFVDGNLTAFYLYGSTKDDGFLAVMMNLPCDVLGYVPWLSEYENSKQGVKPQGFSDWFMEVLVSEKDGHNMVLKMSDTVDNFSNQTNVFTNFTAQTYGFIEGWVYVDQGTRRAHLDDTQNITLWFNSTGGYCTDGTSISLFKADDMTDEWHHFRIEFERKLSSTYSKLRTI